MWFLIFPIPQLLALIPFCCWSLLLIEQYWNHVVGLHGSSVSLRTGKEWSSSYLLAILNGNIFKLNRGFQNTYGEIWNDDWKLAAHILWSLKWESSSLQPIRSALIFTYLLVPKVCVESNFHSLFHNSYCFCSVFSFFPFFHWENQVFFLQFITFKILSQHSYIPKWFFSYITTVIIIMKSLPE